MKLVINKSLKEKIKGISNPSKEPSGYENKRTIIFFWSFLICLIFLPLKFYFSMGMSIRSTVFLSGCIFTGLIMLTSMIRPDTKSFWLLFLNFFIGLPLVITYFPFEEFMNYSAIFEVFFGLITIWIPVVYLIYFTWDCYRRRKINELAIVGGVQKNKHLKLKLN